MYVDECAFGGFSSICQVVTGRAEIEGPCGGLFEMVLGFGP